MKQVYCEDCGGLGWDDIEECLSLEGSQVFTSADFDDMVYKDKDFTVLICPFCDGEGLEEDTETLEERWIDNALYEHFNYRGITWHYCFPEKGKPYVQVFFQWRRKQVNLFKLPMLNKHWLFEKGK